MWTSKNLTAFEKILHLEKKYTKYERISKSTIKILKRVDFVVSAIFLSNENTDAHLNHPVINFVSHEISCRVIFVKRKIIHPIAFQWFFLRISLC